MEIESLALIIPVALFVCVTLIIFAHFYFKHRGRQLVLQALQSSLDKTGSADQNLMDALAIDKPSPAADLRKGSLFLAIAIAIGLFALFIGEADALGPLLGIAAFPALIGLTYLVFYRISFRKSQAT
ncbi:MAG: DUF6249 domain-containing protein [Pseudomonadota bacterium]